MGRARWCDWRSPANRTHFGRDPVLDRGLIWGGDFSRPTGKTLVDRSGYGAHGAITDIAWVTTEYGPALKGDTAFGSQLVQVQSDNHAHLDNPVAVSYEFFLRADTAPGYALLLNKGSRNKVFGGGHSTEWRPYFEVDYDTSSVNCTGGELNVGQWYHIVCTWSTTDDTGRIYVDGAFDASEAGSGSPVDDSGSLRLFCRYSGNSEFPGTVVAARIYDRVLALREIQQRREICLRLPRWPLWVLPWLSHTAAAAAGAMPMAMHHYHRMRSV